MTELKQKYVFHIPCYKRKNNQIEKIDTKLVDKLIKTLNEYGFDSLYITKVTGYYKSRSFDEILITLFTEAEIETREPDHIFKTWYTTNHEQLKQESYAYEKNNTMIIEKVVLGNDMHKFIYRQKTYSDGIMEVLCDVLEEEDLGLSESDQEIFVEMIEKRKFPQQYFTDRILNLDKILEDKEHFFELIMANGYDIG